MEKNIIINKLLLKKKFLLKIGISRSFGKNIHGRTTVFGKSMLYKMKFYIINYVYVNKLGLILEKVTDYYRSSFIGLVLYKNGFLAYKLLEDSANVGDIIPVLNFGNNYYKNSFYSLKNIPLNFKVFGIERFPYCGMIYSRAAGNFSILISKTKNWVYLKLKSGWKLKLLNLCIGTIGLASNLKHFNVILSKAGVSRYLGKRPKVRGVAMNPCDHPHGGGEGKSSGKKAARTPWGKLTKTFPTTRSKNRKKLYGSFKI